MPPVVPSTSPWACQRPKALLLEPWASTHGLAKITLEPAQKASWRSGGFRLGQGYRGSSFCCCFIAVPSIFACDENEKGPVPVGRARHGCWGFEFPVGVRAQPVPIGDRPCGKKTSPVQFLTFGDGRVLPEAALALNTCCINAVAATIAAYGNALLTDNSNT